MLLSNTYRTDVCSSLCSHHPYASHKAVHVYKKCSAYSWVYVGQYCAKIDEAARNRMELIVPELAKRNGVTEKLKADTKWNGYGR